jgi:hypothetical protein
MTDPFDIDNLDHHVLDAEALCQDALRAPQLLPPPSMPMDVARVFVEKACLTDRLLTLRHWRGGWWVWRTSHWIEAEDRAVRALLYRFTEKALYATDKGMKPWAPTKRKIGDLSEALAAICILPADRDQPSWLDDRKTGVVVSVANGLLDVEGRRLLPHTPQFFNQTSVPFAYEPGAPEPTRWLKFLDQLWSGEEDPIKLLGEWFGYVISGRLDLQKIFLNVGPTRGGKGVIARVLTALDRPPEHRWTDPKQPRWRVRPRSPQLASHSPSFQTRASRAGTAVQSSSACSQSPARTPSRSIESTEINGRGNFLVAST